MTAILTALQHQGPSKATYYIMLPPSYSDHDPLPPPSFDPLSMILSQYPIVTQFVKFITTGDLIQLSRTSSTIRETLLQSPEYWHELLSRTTLVCSETTHIKGDNVKSCVICSMPVCETCIVKSDFHGTSGTFSNRIRTFCDSCWSATDFSHPPNSPHSSAPPLCVCVAKDGWLCSHCRATERDELRENKYTCATDGCSQPHNTSEKQRVCTWCRLPLPPAWRPVTAEQIPISESPGANGNNVPEDDAPGYEEGSGSIGGRGVSDVLDSPVDKVKIAGWDQMTEEERQNYQTAWLAKGARERAREAVVRKSEPGLSDGAAPGFEDIGNEETGEASGSANVEETGEASGSGGITDGANGTTGIDEAVGKLKLKDIDHSGGSS